MVSAIGRTFRPKARSVCGAKSSLIIHLVALESQKLEGEGPPRCTSPFTSGEGHGDEMKACVLQSPAPIESNPLQFTDVVMPAPGLSEVMVRVRACGVCRTDLHVIEGELAPRKSPVIPGHQVVGVVEKQGENAGRFAIGARVGIAWLHRTDGTCG